MAFHGKQIDRFILPAKPMSPLRCEQLPIGAEWCYQLKWDGVRSLACMTDGQITLLSKSGNNHTQAFPEVVAQLKHHFHGNDYVLDGEIIMYDTALQRPVFQRILQRVRSKRIVSTEAGQPFHIIYVVFDLLAEGTTDWSVFPFHERHARLLTLLPEKHPQLFVTDLFTDGAALWNWVETQTWEGVIAKRLDSVYSEGKRHQDWWKRKTKVELEVTVPGFILREGRIASLLMIHDEYYVGRVSLGLTSADRAALLAYGEQHRQELPQLSIPTLARGEQVLWLDHSLTCQVTGLELTADGLLRHPKLLRHPELLHKPQRPAKS